MDRFEKEKLLSQACRQMLVGIGEDVERFGLKDTPDRFSRSITELTEGYGISPMDVVKDAIFPCESDGLILQKNLEFYSLCEHHLLPFFGKAHVAYLPNKKIIGLSKIGRIIDIFSKRLQVQENLTHEIALAVDSVIKPLGVAVVIEAEHFCLMMRGVKKQHSRTITSEFLGLFKSDPLVKKEFLDSIK